MELEFETRGSQLEFHPLQHTKNLEQSITLKCSKNADFNEGGGGLP